MPKTKNLRLLLTTVELSMALNKKETEHVNDLFKSILNQLDPNTFRLILTNQHGDDLDFFLKLLTSLLDCMDEIALEQIHLRQLAELVQCVVEANWLELNESVLIRFVKFCDDPKFKDFHQAISNMTYELKGNVIRRRLEILKQFPINEASIKTETFLNELRFISIEMNGKQCEPFDFDIFVESDLFEFLARLFSFLIEKISQSLSENHDDDDDESYEVILKDLLEIFNEILRHRSLKYVGNFLRANMLTEIITFFDNSSVIEYFFERFLNMLYKIAIIFPDISRGIHYFSLNTESNFAVAYLKDDSTSKLSAIKYSLEALHTRNKHEKYLREKSFLKSFLKAMAYLENINPSKRILTKRDYQFIASSSYTANYFKEKVTNEFRKISEIVEWEFINELNQIETQKVTRITNHFGRVLNNSSNYLVRGLKQIKDTYTTDEHKEIAYECQKNFFKSILFYGLDIEKVMCLDCLIKFVRISSIRDDLVSEVNLIEQLKNDAVILENECSREANNQNEFSSVNGRLLKGVKEFLNKIN